MNSTLQLDWCGYDAAKFAVENWHYSHSLPTPPLVRLGVWENDRFVGVILFGRGAAAPLLSPYGLKLDQGAELVRIALREHETPVSRLVAISLHMLKKAAPNLRLVISFADPDQGHHGGIYQANGWIYTGQTAGAPLYRDKVGRVWHSRMVAASGQKKVYGRWRHVLRPQDCEVIHSTGRYRYLMPLDKEMRTQIEKLAKPYPKRAGDP